MIYRDNNHIAKAGQVFAVVGRLLVAGAVGVAAAMDPEQHGPSSAVVQARRPDVEPETVLSGTGRVDASGTVLPIEKEGLLIVAAAVTAVGLRAERPPGARTANTGPRRRGSWRGEACFAVG